MSAPDAPATTAPMWRYVPSLVLIALIACVSLSSRGLVVYRFVQDAFVVFDAMWRAAAGQTPHIDFPSPIGQAYYWPFLALAKLGDVGVATLLRANVLVAVVATVICAATLPRRMSPLLFSVAVLTIALMAITPRDFDAWIYSFSFLAPYNSWSYTFILIVPFLVFLDSRTPRSLPLDVADGLLLGLVLGIIYYLKITFFVPAVGLVFAGLVLRGLRLPILAASVAAFAVMFVGVELVFHNNGAYLADIAAAAKVSAGGAEGFRLGKAARHVAEAAAYGVVLVAALWVARPDRNLVRWGLSHWRALLVAAGVMLAGAAIATQNHPFHQHAMSVAGLLVGLQLAQRPRAGETGARGSGAVAAYAVAVALAAILPILDGASVVAHALVSRSPAVCDVPVLGGLRSGLLVRAGLMTAGCKSVDMHWIDVSRAPANPESEDSKDNYYAAYQLQQLQEGVELLRQNIRQGDVVFAAAFSNPYPFIFGEPPPKFAQIWWHLDRNFSKTYHPEPARLLGSVDLVMLVNDGCGRDVWNIYGPYVTAHFQLVAETPRWRLWRRLAAGQPAGAARS